MEHALKRIGPLDLWPQGIRPCSHVPPCSRVEKYVTVQFAKDMPPRISAWRPYLGCTALPPGATTKDIKHLPQVKIKAPKFNPEDVMWPNGDKLPNSPLIDKAKAVSIV